MIWTCTVHYNMSQHAACLDVEKANESGGATCIETVPYVAYTKFLLNLQLKTRCTWQTKCCREGTPAAFIKSKDFQQFSTWQTRVGETLTADHGGTHIYQLSFSIFKIKICQYIYMSKLFLCSAYPDMQSTTILHKWFGHVNVLTYLNFKYAKG